MSTNKTTNYALHSWLPTDEFHLTEINENFAALDAALKGEATTAAAAQAALNTAVGQRVRMVTGSYIGQTTNSTDSQIPQHIDLGFKPKAVVVISTYRGTSSVDLSFLAVENGANNNAVILTASGFTVSNVRPNGAYMNYAGVYQYVAFY